MLRLQLVDGRCQPCFFLGGQIAGQRRGLSQRAAGSFPHNDRADAGHRLAEGLRNGEFLLARSGHDGSGARLQKVRPCRLGRQRVGKARQQLADLAVVKIDPLQGINDAATLDKHQIGVPPHQLDRQRVGDEVAHLIGAAEIKIDDAVPRLAPQLDQTAACQVLAQQHAEARGRKRVFKAFPCQTDTGRAAARRQQQTVGLGAGAQRDKHLIPGRLENFINFRIQQGVFQFTGDQRQRCGI